MPGRISAAPPPSRPVEPGDFGQRSAQTRDGFGAHPTTDEVDTDDGEVTGDGGAAVGGPLVPQGGRIDRYTVLSELGCGGMGVVYKAWDPALDRPVALKVMVAGRFAARRQINRFLNEARAIARLDDPTLVAVYDAGLVEGCPFFTMEYIDGTPLDAALAIDGPLAPTRAARVAAAIARGLHHAHGQGVVHRDVKPANVLIDEHDRARLIDFGIARLLEAGDGQTRTGVVLGTPAFMAPEQADVSSDRIGPPTDVYGVGGLLYHALTAGAPTPVSPDAPLVVPEGEPWPRDLRAICARALAAEPGERYPSAEALALDLERFLRGEPVEAALPGRLRRLGWWLRRRARPLGAAALAAAVGLAVFGAVWSWRADRRAEAEATRRMQREAAATERLDEALDAARRLRAAGQPERAETVERDAAQSPTVFGTRALARFHLTRAHEATRRDDIEGALAAASAAYATAESAAPRFEAMQTLGRLFARRLDASGLAALLSTMSRRFPERHAEGAPLRFYDRVLAGDYRAAAALADLAEPDWAPMLDAIGRATATAHRLPALSLTRRWYRPWVADVDGDGAPELWTGDRLLSTADPSLPVIEWPAPPSAAGDVRPVDGLPGAFLTLRPEAGRLVQRGADGWRTLYADDAWFADPVAAADLDRDGRAEVYAMTAAGLRTLLPGPGPRDPWRAVVSDLGIDAVGAFIVSLRRVDLGEPLLLVTTQGWSAYDLRLYRAAGEGRIELAARRQTGRMRDAVALPDPDGRRLIAAAVHSEGVDRALFHRDDDGPLPDGIHIFEWTADGLEHRSRLPMAPGHEAVVRLWAGDVDGDGLADLLSMVGTADPRKALLHRRLPAGWARPLPLRGIYPFGLLDVDGDGDAEVLGNDMDSDRLWVLGAGQAQPPVRRAPTLPPADATGRAAAIEDLVALGRLEEALDAAYREMLVGRQPARAARIAERLERHDEAAELYLLAAEQPGRTVEALTAAADARRAARRPRQEREILVRLLATDLSEPRRAAIRARLDAVDATLATRIRDDFERGLDPAWRVRMPDRLHLDRRDGSLLVDGDVAGETARLPLRRVADRVALEVDLRTTRVEYAGAFDLALVARGADGRETPVFELADRGWGGGSILYHRAFVELPEGDQMLIFNEQIDGTDGRTLRVYVEYDHATGHVLLIDRETGRSWRRRVPIRPLGEDMALVVRHNGGPRGSSTTVRARLDSLVLDGFTRRASAPDPLDEAARALVEGRTADALALLGDRSGGPAEAIRIAALYDRGDWAAGDARVRRHLADGLEIDSPVEWAVRHRLRNDPLHFAPMVRAALGPRADAYLWGVFVVAFVKHRADPETVRAAEAALIGADDDPRVVLELPEPHLRLNLWLTRARMRRAADDRGGARAGLSRIEAALELLPPPDDRAATLARDRLWAAVRLEVASLDALDDPAGAAARVRAALDGAIAPTNVADRILADDDLRRLADQPVWREVQAAARR